MNNTLTLDGIWTDDNKLRRIFSWLTRIGAAPKFGTLPIAYYQQDQCKAIDAIGAALKYHEMPEYSQLRVKCGSIEAKAGPGGTWQRVALVVCGQITTLPKRQVWSNAECGE